jgi:excisionase family DNA binding protein
MTPQQRLLLTVRESAERLGLSYVEVYRRIAKGEINAVRSGAKMVIRAADLDAYVAGLQPVGGRPGAYGLKPPAPTH